MTDAIHEQLSAFLDGELSAAESELLLKRVERDGELSARLKRHMLVGDALRATEAQGPSRAFATRVASAIEGESLPGRARWVANQWLKPVAGGAIAAGVAAMVLVSLQTNSPAVDPVSQLATTVATDPANADAAYTTQTALVPSAVVEQAAIDDGIDRYVVPLPSGVNRVAPPIQVLNQGQLANYVVAHSEYSSPLGRRNVLMGLLAGESADRFVLDAALEAAAANAVADERSKREQAADAGGSPMQPAPTTRQPAR